MGYWLRFHVSHWENPLDLYGARQEGPYVAPQVLSYFGGLDLFVSRVFPIQGYDQPSVRRITLPSGFRLAYPEVPNGVTENADGVPLYGVVAGEVGRIGPEPDSTSPLDQAMMAYIRELPHYHLLIPHVIP